MGKIMVCPVCGGDDFNTLDKVDVDTYVLACTNCGWTGADYDLKEDDV